MEKLTETQEIETETKSANPSRKFNLKFGYQDKESPELFHREIVISRRPTGADYNKAKEDGGHSNIQFDTQMLASAVTKFGQITMPVPQSVLLSLKRADREKLLQEFYLFLEDTANGGAQKLEDGTLQLAFGFERGGQKYTHVQFGNQLSGFEEITIEREAMNEQQRKSLYMAKEISVVKTTDGNMAAESLTLAEIESLDVYDFVFLQAMEVEWVNSFRY